jgi:hypothetical protein
VVISNFVGGKERVWAFGAFATTEKNYENATAEVSYGAFGASIFLPPNSECVWIITKPHAIAIFGS